MQFSMSAIDFFDLAAHEMLKVDVTAVTMLRSSEKDGVNLENYPESARIVVSCNKGPSHHTNLSKSLRL
jgi:hypothetical protein